jgi:DNA mismatch repair protein MutL
MGKVKLLDPSVVEKIAAGEIVDRPASIVKELIENSLDAGSSRIEIELKGGGLEQIVISDNGCGMEEGDAVLALQRHATSKISAFEDLEEIQSYGFRGEALASTAAVSRLELTTGEKGGSKGTRVVCEGGEIKMINPSAPQEGTRITVQDLFFNLPARKKFLKSLQSEESACLDLIGKMALTRCSIRFQVKRNGKIWETYAAGESLQQRFLKLFPQTPDSQLFPVEIAQNSMRLTGFIGAPLFSKSNRNQILIYVNSRLVKPGVLSQAVVDGYSGYLEAGKFPVVVLFLEIAGKWVDVNVHPAKVEVRFSHPKEVYGFVEKSIALKLREIQEGIRPHVIPFYHSDSNSNSYLPSVYLSGSSGRTQELALFEQNGDYQIKTRLNPAAKPKFLSFVARTYGLFQEEDVLFLVDQHLAHERLNFDLLESRLKDSACPSQELLTPMSVQLPSYQVGIVQQYREFFRTVGLDVEDFGSGTVLVRSVPLGLEKIGSKSFFLSFLEKVENLEDSKSRENIYKKILMTMACRSSIQAGDEISPQEMISLFERLLNSSNPYFCPHGRPALIKLALDEVHKLFRRK